MIILYLLRQFLSELNETLTQCSSVWCVYMVMVLEVLEAVFVFVPSYCTLLFVEHSFITWAASQRAIKLLWQPSD